MSIFEQASKLKLRFFTTKGLLSTEQLWDISIKELDILAVSLEKQLETTETKTFLVEKTQENKTLKLMFDLALYILKSKVAEQELLKNLKEKKAKQEKIMSLIEDKQEDALKNLPIEELEKLLNK